MTPNAFDDPSAPSGMLTPDKQASQPLRVKNIINEYPIGTKTESDTKLFNDFQGDDEGRLVSPGHTGSESVEQWASSAIHHSNKGTLTNDKKDRLSITKGLSNSKMNRNNDMGTLGTFGKGTDMHNDLFYSQDPSE